MADEKKVRKLALNIVLALGLEDEEQEEALAVQLEALGNNKRCDEAQCEEFADLLTLIDEVGVAKATTKKHTGLAAQAFLAANTLYTRTSQFVATGRTAILACLATGAKVPTFFLTKKLRERGAEEAKLYVDARRELERRRRAAPVAASSQPAAPATSKSKPPSASAKAKAAAKATAKAKIKAKEKKAAVEKKKKKKATEEESSTSSSLSTKESSSSSGDDSDSSSSSSSGSSDTTTSASSEESDE